MAHQLVSCVVWPVATALTWAAGYCLQCVSAVLQQVAGMAAVTEL